MKGTIVRISVFFFLLLMSYQMMNRPYSQHYIDAMKKDAVTVAASKGRFVPGAFAKSA